MMCLKKKSFLDFSFHGAIVFGDINDKESEVLKLKEDDRMYHLLESVGTKPNVVYQVKVRNT